MPAIDDGYAARSREPASRGLRANHLPIRMQARRGGLVEKVELGGRPETGGPPPAARELTSAAAHCGFQA